MNNKNKKIMIGTIIALCVVAIGCFAFAFMPKNEPVAEETTEEAVTEPEPEPEVPVEESEPEPEPEVYTGPRSFLTNLPIKKKLAKVRPIALMIENTSACQPHYGINHAGVIYECPVEGGITRLMAVFENYKGMERIGNVRSCRPYYPRIAKEYGAVYMCFGQSTEGKQLLNSGFIDHINGIEGAAYNASYYRSNDRRAPHNAYTSSDGIVRGLKLKKYKTKRDKDAEVHFNFTTEDEPVILDGKSAAVVSLYYPDNHPYFIYSKKTGLYRRYEFGKEEMDAVDGKQIKVKNIILQNVSSSNYGNTLKLNLGVTGSGEGKYITNGKAIDITWKKDSDSSITRYYDADGKEITLNAGKTWVSLIEKSKASNNKIYKKKKDFK